MTENRAPEPASYAYHKTVLLIVLALDTAVHVAVFVVLHKTVVAIARVKVTAAERARGAGLVEELQHDRAKHTHTRESESDLYGLQVISRSIQRHVKRTESLCPEVAVDVFPLPSCRSCSWRN